MKETKLVESVTVKEPGNSNDVSLPDHGNEKAQAKNNDEMPFEKDPLYTTMLKYMKYKKNFLVMKVTMNKDRLDNDLMYRY